MRVLAVIVCCAFAVVAESATSDTTVALPAADLRFVLSTGGTLQIGSWSLAEYSTSDVYSYQLDVPRPSTSSSPATALSATYGDWLHVFVAAVPEFLSTTELLGRLLDLQQLRRSGRGNVPVMTTYSAQPMIGLIPAEEIAIELRDTTARDSMFTLVTSAPRGSDVVVVVIRSRLDPRADGSPSAHVYRRLLASVEMEHLFDRDTVHIANPAGWSLAVPAGWKNKVSTRLGSMPIVPPSDNDTVWNAVVVQLPYVQIEYLVVHRALSDTAVADYAAHIAERQNLQPWTSPNDILLCGESGWWYRTVLPRRGDLVATCYGVYAFGGPVAAIRLTSWEKDMPHVERFLPDIVRLLGVRCRQ
jgi:hypothetical protein